MLQQVIPTPGPFERQPPAGIDERAVATLVSCAQAALDHDPGSARLYLDRIAALVAGEGLQQHGDARTSAPRGGLTAWQLRRVTSHIEAHLGQPIRVETLAGLVTLSSGHFTGAFKASVGETPHSYVMGQRVRRAQRLMLETGESLSQIACACGFADQAHLTRLFRRVVGQTPLRWRKAIQGERLANAR